MTTLLLTRYPVRDILNPVTFEAMSRFKAMLLEDGKIIRETGGVGNEISEILCASAISWGEEQLRESGKKIDLVCGDAAIPRIVEARGLNYRREFVPSY